MYISNSISDGTQQFNNPHYNIYGCPYQAGEQKKPLSVS